MASNHKQQMIGTGAGPDLVIQATNFTTTLPDGAVCIRKVDADADNYPPVSVPTFLRRAVDLAGDHTAMAVKRGEQGDQWTKWTYRQYLQEVEIAARAFIKLGLEPRHGVGIIGFNSPEWFIADLAAVFAGGMAAGIYPTNGAEACRHTMANCKANILVVEDAKQLEKFKAFRDELTDLKAVVQYTGTPTEKGVIAWKDLLAMGRKESNEALDERLWNIAINQCCHLVYTSGTTGLPKGVMLSHDNLTYTARRLCHTFDLKNREERLISYLPLSHVAANICDIFAMINIQGTVYFADKNALKGTLTQTLKEALPTIFFGVPRVWEKMYEKMQEVGRRNKGLKKQIGAWAKKTGLEHNMNLMNNGRDSGANAMQFKVADAVVFQKIKGALGLNKCRYFFSAAAPISKEVLEYFMSLDIRILEIYGMSECTGPHLSNTYQVQKLGTIGKELPGWLNKIAYAENSSEKGELCIMGRHVMMGYLFNEEKTKETFDDDGWLKSGDIVTSFEVYCSIAGRIKELIITAGGENIPPVLIEDTIKSELPCISNAIVIGDRRKFLACLLTLKVDFDADTMIPQKTLAPNTLAWLQTIGVNNVQTVEEAMKTPAIGEAIQKGIDRANTRATSSDQRIQKWIVIPVDFSLPGGELGPTLKMKRHVVHEKNSQVIEDFYRS